MKFTLPPVSDLEMKAVATENTLKLMNDWIEFKLKDGLMSGNYRIDLFECSELGINSKIIDVAGIRQGAFANMERILINEKIPAHALLDKLTDDLAGLGYTFGIRDTTTRGVNYLYVTINK